MSIFLILVGVLLLLFLQFRYTLKLETPPIKTWYSLSMLLWFAGIVWTFFTYPIVIAIVIAVSSFIVKAVLQSLTEGKGIKGQAKGKLKEEK